MKRWDSFFRDTNRRGQSILIQEKKTLHQRSSAERIAKAAAGVVRSPSRTCLPGHAMAPWKHEADTLFLARWDQGL